MTKVHVIADESLGGVLREYVEVTQFDNMPFPVRKFINGVEVERTDVVRINEEYSDGKGCTVRYRIAERKAEVGEKVLIVKGGGWYEKEVGAIYEVIDGKQFGFSSEYGEYVYVEHSDNCYESINCVTDADYLVMEPVADAKQASPQLVEFTTDDVKYAPEKLLDLLANLARRVTSLESQLASTQENVVRQAEELANLRYLAECSEADIAMLDERSYPLTRDSVRVFLGGGTQQ